MKHRYKIQIGEWVSVYTTTTIFVDTDKDLEKMTEEQVAELLDHDNNVVYETSKEDFDWTTEEHEDWHRTDDPVCVLDKELIKE